MSKVILAPFSKPDPSLQGEGLKISEFFSETIQGEGRYIGYPAVFLRVKDCTLSCSWCDSMAVWKHGTTYTISELLSLMKENGVVDFLKNGAHLVLTGGSPLLQQDQLSKFILGFISVFNFKPFIEVENECVLKPSLDFWRWVDQWNCSPKLASSLQEREDRYIPEAISVFKKNTCSVDFKFVVSSEEDWEEVEEDFLKPGLINLKDIILMPEGETQEELSKTREKVVQMAIEKGVRFSDRLHITIWNKKTGV